MGQSTRERRHLKGNIVGKDRKARQNWLNQIFNNVNDDNFSTL